METRGDATTELEWVKFGGIAPDCRVDTYMYQSPGARTNHVYRSNVGGVQARTPEQPKQARPVGSSESSQRQGLFIEFMINKQLFMFLINTGLSQSCVSDTIINRIGESRKLVLQRATRTVHQADDSPLVTRGKAMAEMQLTLLVFMIEVMVANLRKKKINFQMQTQFVLHCCKLELHTLWETIPCSDYHGQPFFCRIVASETRLVLVGHKAILKGRVAAAIQQWPTPKTIKEVRSFIPLVPYIGESWKGCPNC